MKYFRWMFSFLYRCLKVFVFVICAVLLSQIMTQTYTNIELETNQRKLENQIITLDKRIDYLERGSFKSIRTRARSSVYLVFSDRASGTAFQVMMGGSKYLVTNAHVCRDSKEMSLVQGMSMKRFRQEKPVKPEVRKVLYTDNNFDLCILEGITKNSYLTIDTQPVHIGEEVFLVGHPNGRNLTVTYGDVIEVGSDLWMPALESDYMAGCVGNNLRYNLIFRDCRRVYRSVVETTVLMIPGSSGSPLLTIDGRVVGVGAWYNTELAWATAIPRESLIQTLEKVHNRKSKNGSKE